MHSRQLATTHSTPIMRASSLAALLLLGACSGGVTGTDSAEPPALSLKQFDGPQACEALEVAVESTAAAMMRAQLENLLSYPEIADGDDPVSETAPVAGDDGAGNGLSSGDSNRDAADNYSQTNVQVSGIDELDSIKNDGRFLYSLGANGGQITLSQAELLPAASMRVSGQISWPTAPADAAAGVTNRVAAPEYPVGLFLRSTGGGDTGDQVIAVTSGSAYYAVPLLASPQVAVASDESIAICADTGCGPGMPDWAPPNTYVRGFDVGSNGTQASWKIRLPGQFQAARRIDNHAYIVTQAALQMPRTVRWWPENPRTDIGWETQIDALIADNEQAIAQQSLADWLAPLRGDDASATPSAAECSAYSTPSVGSRLAWSRIHVVNLDDQSVSHHTVMTNGQAFYMNADSLVMTAPHWQYGPQPVMFDDGAATLIHRFALDPSGNTQYVASGALSGSLINRFAIDEKEGVIRVAMTHRWGPEPYSYLATLSNNDGMLTELGRTDRIAPGETLQSARFVGDRAYLVTFEVIDPFFVYDLSDPASPTELGELKIPGFSSYLHPVGSNHVLGIGYDSGNWPRRIKASLFDVTNPASPLEQSVILLGETYTGSEALWDSRAFTFFRPDPAQTGGIMAIPFRSYESSRYGTSNGTGIRLVDVQPSQAGDGLQLRGTLDMSDLLDNTSTGWRNADARRAVFIGDNVYGVAAGAVRSATTEQPENHLDTLLLPQ